MFDIRALWRSVLSARVPECQHLTRHTRRWDIRTWRDVCRLTWLRISSL